MCWAKLRLPALKIYRLKPGVSQLSRLTTSHLGATINKTFTTTPPPQRSGLHRHTVHQHKRRRTAITPPPPPRINSFRAGQGPCRPDRTTDFRLGTKSPWWARSNPGADSAETYLKQLESPPSRQVALACGSDVNLENDTTDLQQLWASATAIDFIVNDNGQLLGRSVVPAPHSWIIPGAPTEIRLQVPRE